MKQCFLILSFVVCSTWVYPNFNDKVHLAEMYFEAKEYPSAEALYREILNGELSSKERAIMTYNLASTLLYEEKWDEATEVFEAIKGTDVLTDYYSYRYYVNSVVAQWKKALSAYKALDEEKEDFVAKVTGVLDTLQGAFQDLQNAQQLYQDLHDEGEGRDPELVEVLIGIKNVFEDLQDRLYAYRVEHLTLEEALPLLIEDLQESLQALTLLHEGLFEEEVQREFLQLFAEEEKGVGPIWEAVRKKLAQNDEKKEDEESFAKAHNEHIAAVELMDEGVAKESYNRQKRAYDILAALQKKNPEKENEGRQEEKNAANEEPDPQEDEAQRAANDVLALLQEMHYDDENKEKKAVPPKQGLRPW